MGTKYSTVSISGYNSSPPPDDSTQTAANQVKWSTIKTKLPDPLKTAIEAINTQLVTYSDFGVRQVSTNDSTTAADYMKTVEIAPGVSTSVTVSLGDAASMTAGYIVTVKNSSAITQTVGRATAGNTINGSAFDFSLPPKASAKFKVIGAETGYIIESFFGNAEYDPVDHRKTIVWSASGVSSGSPRTGTAPNYDFRLANIPAGIGPLPYAGSSIPTGWLECDGSAVSRTTYADLFTAIGTTWGAGNGSTTFNLPDMRNRSPIGAGTGTVTETIAAASVDTSADTLAVSANDLKWITGMTVVGTTTGTLPTGLSLATTYYVIRLNSTTIQLATSLANAQNGTAINITAQGSGDHTFTHTYTARTLGQYGGEESHAMSITELLSHSHTQRGAGGAGGASLQIDGSAGLQNAGSTLTTGGNAAMNIMNPFAVVKYIISY